MIQHTEIDEIMNHLLNQQILPASSKVIKQLSGTTDCQVYAIGVNEEPQYILKLDDPKHLALTMNFHKTYDQISLLPKLLYSAPDDSCIVYSYLSGTTHFHRGLKSNWLPILVKELLNQYEIRQDTALWGRIANPRQSWREFNERSLDGARHNVQGILPAEDYELMASLIDTISRAGKRFLLHGDTGVHNFVFDNSRLKGVIDPSPILGPILYDFTYAFCSSPDDLTLETLMSSYELLRNEAMDRTRLIKEVIFQLYTRIGISAKVHPHDLSEYLIAWDYWKKLLFLHS